MLQLQNNTPFKAALAVFPDENAVDTLYVTVKATFSIGNTVEVAEQQEPIAVADEYWGEPGESSLKYAGELHLKKPSTDIVVVGEACAPDRRPVSHLDVVVSLGRYSKTLRVSGDRWWAQSIMGLRMTAPLPFESMPIVYERAFGGVHVADPEKNNDFYEERNPVGTGFLGKRSVKELDGYMLPNIEDPRVLIKGLDSRSYPASLGFVAPSWEPRKSFAGTYDETWQRTRAPYMPDDFDTRYFNASSQGLTCSNYLKGGEPVFLLNLSPKGPLRFSLPVCDMDTLISTKGTVEKPPLDLETVLLEPGSSRFLMLWRAAAACDKKALKIDQVKINLHRLKLNGQVS